MPLGDPIPLGPEIWQTRPRVGLLSIWGTLGRGIWRGAPAGAAVGGAVGGGAPGIVAGAAAGAALGVLTNAARRLRVQMDLLEQTTRDQIDRYKEFNPIIRRLQHQWTLLDRRMNRAWAETVAPLLKKLTDIGVDFREQWERTKMRFYRTFEPLMSRLLDIFRSIGSVTLRMFDRLLRATEAVINGFTKVARFFNILPEDEGARRPTVGLRPFPFEWPTIEGPLTAAMRRTGLTGPPFTRERREPSSRESRRESDTERLYRQGHLQGQPGAPAHEEIDRPMEMPPLNLNFNVSDSKALSDAFEEVWRRAVFELRKREADSDYIAFTMQSKGSYV